jgi:hypothetical protein
MMNNLPLFALLALSLAACGGAVEAGDCDIDPEGPGCTSPVVDSGPSQRDTGPTGCQGLTPYCSDGCGGLQAEMCEGNEWVCPISGGCVSPPGDASEPDSGIWTEDGGTWTEDGGTWTEDGGIWTSDGGIWTEDGGYYTDGGYCVGEPPTCVSECGQVAPPYCNGGVWECSPFPPCYPADASVCPGSPPECMSWCGDVSPSYCDGDGNWACPPDLCDQLPDASAPGDGGYYWNDGGVIIEDGGVIYGPDASPSCNEIGCPEGAFCELQGIEGPDPQYFCEELPPACEGNQTCACVIQQGAFDCPAPFGWTCTVTGMTVTVGCVAP